MNENVIPLIPITLNACGDCKMCCKLFVIDDPELKKPAGQWCEHCEPAGIGCTKYETRPKSCRDFECVWLQSQKYETPMPLEMRPDHSNVVLGAGANGESLLAHVNPGTPGAWQEGAVFKLLRGVINSGAKVAIVTGSKRVGFHGGRRIEWWAAPAGEAPPEPPVTGSSEPAP